MSTVGSVKQMNGVFLLNLEVSTAARLVTTRRHRLLARVAVGASVATAQAKRRHRRDPPHSLQSPGRMDSTALANGGRHERARSIHDRWSAQHIHDLSVISRASSFVPAVLQQPEAYVENLMLGGSEPIGQLSW